MCISNIPTWFQWLTVIAGPILIILLNIFLFRKFKNLKKYKVSLIIASIIIAILWIDITFLRMFVFC